MSSGPLLLRTLSLQRRFPADKPDGEHKLNQMETNQVQVLQNEKAEDKKIIQRRTKRKLAEEKKKAQQM